MTSFAAMRRFILDLFILFALLVAVDAAHWTPAHAKNQPNVYSFEFLNFRYGDGQATLLEIFCQIPARGFQFIKAEDRFLARYELFVQLEGARDSVHCASYADSFEVGSFWEIDQPRAPHLLRLPFPLKPGEYQASVRITDPETEKTWHFNKRVYVPDYNHPRLRLSDLQFARKISVSAEKSPLVKNKRKILPNVGRVFGGGLDIVYTYVEIYNLAPPRPGARNSFKAECRILNTRGQSVKTLTFERQKPGDTCTLSLGIPIQGLAEGEYVLNIRVRDHDSAEVASKSSRFNVVRPVEPTWSPL